VWWRRALQVSGNVRARNLLGDHRMWSIGLHTSTVKLDYRMVPRRAYTARREVR